MSENDIRALLDKYFEGGTSLEEEALLREFFASASASAAGLTTDPTTGLPADLPSDLHAACAMFGHFAQAAATKCPASVQLPPAAAGRRTSAEPKPALRPRRRIFYTRISAAAVIALAVGLAITLHESRHPDKIYCYVNGKPVTDSLEAAGYVHAMMADVTEALAAPARSLATVRELGLLMEAAGNTPAAPSSALPSAGETSRPAADTSHKKLRKTN